MSKSDKTAHPRPRGAYVSHGRQNGSDLAHPRPRGAYDAKTLSVSLRSVNAYLADTDRQLKAARKERIFDMWLSCATQQEEIAAAVGVDQDTVSTGVRDLRNLDNCPKSVKLSALYDDAEWTPPIYDVWTFAKKTNAVAHFGNTEQRIARTPARVGRTWCGKVFRTTRTPARVGRTTSCKLFRKSRRPHPRPRGAYPYGMPPSAITAVSWSTPSSRMASSTSATMGT